MFQELDFTVEVKHDLARDEIKETAVEFAAKDHSQFDVFVFFILSHGGDIIIPYLVVMKRLSVSESSCACSQQPNVHHSKQNQSSSSSNLAGGAVTHFQELSVHRRLTSCWLLIATTPGHGTYRDTPTTGSFFMNVSSAMLNTNQSS